ncbi:MAG: hypothetical protein IJL19_01925 [Clostridiales bacterium]|nr:hypothetical protein [Clostridiales bacterium]
MIFKEGIGWKCCYDPETGLYTARTGGGGNVDLYEITKEIFDQVDDPGIEWPTRLISQGRHLFMSVDDRCGPPYTVVFDEDYKKICPWTEPQIAGKIWSEEMTDAAVEVFASEENNREQRRAKKAQREKKKSE